MINGDLNKLDCDAVLVPVDEQFYVTSSWTKLVGDHGGRIAGVDFPQGSRVVRYRHCASATREPDVWLGNLATVGESGSWYADGLVEFVNAASAGLVQTSPPVRPRRLAVNVAGSGLGGFAHDKGALYKVIVPALKEAARTNGVDVVLVCWGAKSYSAAQRARLSPEFTTGSSSPSLGSPRDECADELSRQARRGDLVLFIGAGVSMSAGLVSWQGLLDALLSASPQAEPIDATRLRRLDVRDQAAIIRDLYDGDASYRRALEQQVQAHTRYSLTHGLLASLGTRENVTTNYDTLFEAALETPGRGCTVLPYQPALAGTSWLLKLHGSIDRPEHMVLTREDYLSLPGRSGALFGILQAMLMTKHMLFVGYSLNDDSFHRVMHEVRQVVGNKPRQKLGTALVLFRDPLLDRLWGDVLDIVPMMDAPAGEPSDEEKSIAARQLDLMLDRICSGSADVAAFLLDHTYRNMLSEDQRAISAALTEARALAQNSPSTIAKRVVDLLSGFDVP